MGGTNPFHRSRRILVLAVAVGTLFVLAAACGGGGAEPATDAPSAAPARPTPAPAVLRPAALLAGEKVPAPKGAPVLTLTGKITALNGNKSLRFDPATLDQLELVQVSVYEPWVKQNLQFQGVWLQDLMKVAQPDGSAQSVHLTALDDYQVDLKMSEIMAGGILLATKKGDGSPIPIEEGGPTRIVFVDGTPSGASADQWIWSLSTIDVR